MTHGPGNLVSAGEGAQLPRGLSLFRFVLFSGLMLGAVYGGLALHYSMPPPVGYQSPQGLQAKAWEPSPGWLPAWIMVKARLGISRTAEGYSFKSQSMHALFGSGTMVLGILMGGVVGWLGGDRARQKYLEKRARQRAERKLRFAQR